MNRKTWQAVLLAFSLIGVGISIYLTTVHYQNVPLICSSQGVVDCARVLSSPYSVVPGTEVPITIPGLGWSLISAALAFIGLRSVVEPSWLPRAQFAWALLGMLTVLYLVYVEIVRLHTICAWCTGLHVIILVMFLITLVRLQSPQEELEAEDEIEQPVVPTKTR